MADLSSILGGMVQGFKDFGTGLVDFFGTGAANIGDIASSIATGRATTKNQDDFRKWLYQTDDKQDAAAKGLGTILNGVSTVADVMPGAQAVTANPLFNGLQGAIGGVSDELKMAGKDADWGRAAQRAGVGAASGLASAYAGQGLAKTGNKLLSNGLTRGAVSGALGGGIANAGYTGIEGGSVQDMINAGLYGAQTGALVGGTTGLARELIKPTHKMDVALTDDEKAARIANIDDQLGKLDLSTPEGNARYNELEQARNNYSRQAQFDLLQKTNPMTDDYHTGIRSPEDIRTLKSIVDGYNEDNNFTYPDFTLLDAQKALANGNIDVYSSKPIEAGAFISPSKMMATDYAGGGEVYTKNIPLDDFAFIESGDEGNYLPVAKKPKTVADLMNEPKQKTVADLMLSPEQKEFFKDSAIRDENGNLKKKTTNGVKRVGSKNVAQVDLSTLPESMKAAKSYLNKDYIKDIESYSGKKIGDMTDAELMEYALKDKPAETRDIYRVGIEDIVKGGRTMRQVAENYAANRYLNELAEKNFDDIDSKALVSYLLNNAHRLNDSKTRAADIELSDRLGIGQSNTFMDDYRVPYDAQGVFDVADSTISIRPELSQESAVNTVAHERLHSFQTENDIKRYDKRVLNAYDDLAKELKPLLKTPEETAKRYRFDADYWGNEREQQSRMLQQYLENKGYTKGGLQEANVGEWGNEINPAFDKFFDKLRALSKKGVALPALTALFGGGAIMAATQGDDKKKKSEVK